MGADYFLAELAEAETFIALMQVSLQLALCRTGWWAFLSLVPPLPVNELALVRRGSDLAITFGQRGWVTRIENDCWSSLAFGDANFCRVCTPTSLEKPTWAPEEPDKTWCYQPKNICTEGSLQHTFPQLMKGWDGGK